MAEYWNHNTAYHPWLASIAREHGGDVLDVGCVSVRETTFAEYESAGACFDLITFVATIHHMDLRASLLKAQRPATAVR